MTSDRFTAAEARLLIDALDVLIGAYPSETQAQIQKQYSHKTAGRDLALQLIDRLSLHLSNAEEG